MELGFVLIINIRPLAPPLITSLNPPLQRGETGYLPKKKGRERVGSEIFSRIGLLLRNMVF